MLAALWLFLQSFVMGFSMAAPVGPVGVLCIRRTLRSGWLSGFTTGLGVAIADSLFGLIAGLGLTAVSTTLLEKNIWIHWVGSVALIVIGWQIFRSEPPRAQVEVKRESQWMNFLSAFVLAVTNPLTVLSFAAVFLGLGIGSETAGRGQLTLLFVAGIFFGSCLWWGILSLGAAYFRRWLTPERLLWVNRACGAVIFLFGCGLLLF